MEAMHVDNSGGLEGRPSNGEVSLNVEDGASVGTVHQGERYDKDENMEDSAYKSALGTDWSWSSNNMVEIH